MRNFWLEIRKDKFLAVVCAIFALGIIHEALNIGSLFYGYPDTKTCQDVDVVILEQVKAHREALLQECRNQCPKPKENRFKRLFKGHKNQQKRPASNRSQVK